MEAGAGAGDELPGLSDATNVLLLVPSGSALQAYFDTLGQSPPAEAHVLAVTYTSQPDEWVEAWNTHVGEPPASGGIVTVGQPETEFENDHWSASAVESPADLTGTGIALSNQLSTLAESAGAEAQVTVYFDSVTALLQHADLQRSFRFLHVVTGRVRNADARCYYHLDPTAHDEQAMATLSGLFDATLEYDDGVWRRTD